MLNVYLYIDISDACSVVGFSYVRSCNTVCIPLNGRLH